jgi:hypothetical protein
MNTQRKAKAAIKYTKGDNMPLTEREENENLIRQKSQREWLDSIGINRTLPESDEAKQKRLNDEKKAKAIKSYLGS